MIALLLAGALAQAAGDVPGPPALSIGSAAPKPDVARWVRHEPPEFWKPGTVYVVAFWATWSGPGRQSLAGLSRLRDDLRARRVEVVAISDEAPDAVQRFAEREEWRGKARIPLGADPDGSMRREWMEAAHQHGLPTAFIVKEGIIQWIGHPRDAEGTLGKVLDGTWDLRAAKTLFEDAVAADDRQRARDRAMADALRDGDTDRVLELLDAAIAEAGAEASMPLRVQRTFVLLKAGRSDEGYVLAERLAAEDPGVRLWLATGVLRMPIKDRRVDAAIAWIEGATPAGEEPSPQALAELGYAWSLKGDLSRAASFTRRAIDAAKTLGHAGEDWAADLREVLRGFEERSNAGKGDTGAGNAGP